MPRGPGRRNNSSSPKAQFDRLAGATIETKGIRADDSVFPIELSLSAVRVDGEHFLLAIMRDVTERVQAAEALKQSEATYREIFNAANDAIFLLDENATILDVNDKMDEMFGYPADKARGMNVELRAWNSPLFAGRDLPLDPQGDRRGSADLPLDLQTDQWGAVPGRNQLALRASAGTTACCRSFAT